MTRTRNFVFVVYPDSAPFNWVHILDDFHIQACISPLHDQDVNFDTTNTKKEAHYHVLLMFDSVKTLDQAREIASKVGAKNDIVYPVSSLRGYARYLCHLDNPEKYQYAPELVTSLGGADYTALCSLPSDKYNTIGEMMDFCTDNFIFSLATLCDYARQHREDWFRILCDSGAFIMREYLKSFHWTTKEEEAE